MIRYKPASEIKYLVDYRDVEGNEGEMVVYLPESCDNPFMETQKRNPELEILEIEEAPL